MNRVELRGNIGGTIFDNKKEKEGACFIFSLATSEKYKDRAGNEVVKTEWHKVVSFGTRADQLRKHTIVGSHVMIIGKLKSNEYENESKQKVKTTDIIVESFLIGKSLS